MKSKLSCTTIAFAIYAVSSLECSAGNLVLDVASYPDLSAPVAATAQGVNVDVEKQTDGTWQFRMNSPDQIQGSMKIAIDSPPNGYQPFALTIGVPYFWDQGLPVKFTAAIVKDDLSDAGVATFLRGIGGPPGQVHDIVILRQRASRLWAERAKQLERGDRLEPNADDIRIAYWLLRTTSDLMTARFIESDDISRNAAGWIKRVLADKNLSDRLLTNSSISSDVATKLVRTIEARDSYFYNRIVQNMDKALQSRDKSICPRIERLDEFYSKLDPEDISEYDGEFPNSLKIRADLIACKISVLASQKASKTPISSDFSSQLAELAESSTAMVQALSSDAKSGVDTKFASAAANLNQRIAELQQALK